MYQRPQKPRRAISNAIADIATMAGTTARVGKKSLGLADLALDDLMFEMQLSSKTERREAVMDDLLEQKRLTAEVKLNNLTVQYNKACKDLGL